MSFGFGIGDILAVIELAKKIRKDFADAPSQFKDISLEVRSLSIVLQDIEDELSLPDLNAKQKSELEEIIVGCRDVLEKLQRALSAYGELRSDSRGVGSKAKRIWKRLKWEPDDIKEFRSRVTTNVTFLNAFRGKYTNEILHQIKNGADQFHERQDDRELNKESLAILDWLTPINHAAQQHDYITQRQVDTGQWLLDSPVFIEWVNSDKQKLFCPGIPGAGKTMLTSIVVEELNNRFRNDKDVGIAYFYCNFRRQHDQKIDDLLLSLLKQLSGYQASLPGAVKEMFDLHSPRQNRPSTKEISSALKSVIDSYSKVFIVVDALDECQMTNGCRMQFLSEIFDIQETYQLSLFATSRHIPDIEERFDGSLRLEIRASDKDVERYLDGRISQLPEYVRKSTGLQNEVKTAIIKAVDGMFLLARLNFDSLRGKKSPKVMRNALNSLPTGSAAYRYAYKDAMERIEGQLDDERDLAKQVLSWITFAKRPLTTAELQEAIAVEIDETELDQENFTEISTMISVCAGLVTVDEESKIIRLVHYTTQEYFERTRDKWFPDAETFITTICVTYLSFETFNTGLCLWYRDFAKRVRSHQFSMYAARFWGHHAGKASILEKKLEQALLKFLENQAKVDASWQLMNSDNVPESYVDQGSSPGSPISYYGRFQRRGLTGMHITAFFGLETVIKLLLDSGKLEVDPRDLLSERSNFIPDPNVVNQDRTPLSYAAEQGHEKVVNLLLDTGKVEVDSIDQSRQTPLRYSVESGNEKVVKLLLNTGKVNVNFKDDRGQTPFYKAAESGNENVVKLFLETGKVEIDTTDNFDGTPLLGAVRKGYESIVKLLLNAGAVKINQNDLEHRTPVSYAAEEGFESIVKLLLDTNSVDVNIVDGYGRTPISYAAKGGFEFIVKLLLDTNSADINIADRFYKTPISYAAKGGFESIVKLLLDTNSVDINIVDINQQTPIAYALEKGYESIAMLLLSTGKVDISYLDPSGLEIFWWVACWGHEPIVKQLLNTGFNLPITQPGPVEGVWWEGVWWEDEGKVKLLIKRYADMNIDIHPATEENIRKLWPRVLESSGENWNEQLERVICEGMAFKDRVDIWS
ncbi:uncharacterized protein EAE98_000681 [Botrytis deweyae]|uniref:NACHT domain-containing protein n=1 Tax=Botrytis deweyae TaxID=2478750 RepID=A0ABQ7J3D2_9HELO|nr:uncharacterized protein EAE98_000681 [Botrytis deweyae]KAF7940554.1 hypothetical protein EAE98_000681 [Botrytis deweyae]